SWSLEENLNLGLDNKKLLFLFIVVDYYHKNIEGELILSDLIDLYRDLDKKLYDRSTESLIEYRANKLVSELISDNILNRFEYLGSSIYRLSSLGITLGEFYFKQFNLKDLKLSDQLSLVDSKLEKLYKLCLENKDNENHIFWENEVYATLKYLVTEIFDSIDLFQRSMDKTQTNVKDNISALLEKSWIDAIDSCIELLNNTSSNLKELQDSLNAVAGNLENNLLLIKEIIFNKIELNYIKSLLDNLSSKLDKIIYWSQKSIELWAEYDKHVHKFIRTAINIDKDKLFLKRLSLSVKEYTKYPWYLEFISANRLPSLREEEISEDLEVTGLLESEVDYIDFENDMVIDEVSILIEDLIKKTEKDSLDIVEFLRNTLKEYPKDQHFKIAIFVYDKILKAISKDDISQSDIWYNITDYGASVLSKRRY
ncbi:MAG: hypothetical protein R3Y52_02095, partial [Psittacicella sp.]